MVGAQKKILLMTAAILIAGTTMTHAVVVEISEVSGGDPLPGTTISLETVEGEEIALEVTEVALVEEEPVDSSSADVSLEQDSSTDTTAETTTEEVTETPSSTSADSTNGGSVAKVVVKDKVTVGEDGSAKFDIDDRYKDKTVVVVIKDKEGNEIDRRRAVITGSIAAIIVNQLPRAGVSDASSTGIDTAGQQRSRPRTASDNVGQNGSTQIADAGGAGQNAADVYGKPSFSFEAGAGELDRQRFSPLRLQTALPDPIIIEENFASVKRDDDFKRFSLSGQTAPEYAIPGLGSGFAFFGNAQYGHSDVSESRSNVSAMGYGLGILGPEGPSGTLGGGLAISPGAGDLLSMNYDDEYEEFLVQVGAKTKFDRNGLYVTPSASVFFGRTQEDLAFGGNTNGGNVDFLYEASADSNRLGLQIGTELSYMPTPSITLFGSLDARLVYNWTDTDARLTISGALDAEESASASADESDLGLIARGGIRFQRGNLTAEFGAQVETWQVPMPRITGEEPLFVQFMDRESCSLFGRLTLRF